MNTDAIVLNRNVMKTFVENFDKKYGTEENNNSLPLIDHTKRVIDLALATGQEEVHLDGSDIAASSAYGVFLDLVKVQEDLKLGWYAKRLKEYKCSANFTHISKPEDYAFRVHYIKMVRTVFDMTLPQAVGTVSGVASVVGESADNFGRHKNPMEIIAYVLDCVFVKQRDHDERNRGQLDHLLGSVILDKRVIAQLYK